MNEKKQQTILNIILGFVLLQPLFDILSRLAILDVLPNISTYLKPLFVFIVAAYLLFKYSPFKRKWITYSVVFVLFTIGHLFLLYQLLLGKSLILHELRFIINIAYMIALFISLFTLYHWCRDKESMMKKIKYTVVFTFGIYFALYLLAIVTGTSGLTYEYSDKYKLGFKGWNDSGQILGHAFSMLFPLILYFILKPKNHKIIRLIFLALAIISVSLLGTKVPYFITLIVLAVYLISVLLFKIIKKDFVSSKFNILIVVIAMVAMVGTYQFTPVAYNSKINAQNAKIELELYNLDSISGKKKDVDYEKLMKDNPNSNLSYVKKYFKWGQQSSAYLETLFYEGKVHPSNTRAKQLFYSLKKFELADVQYKVLGLGFLNQDSILALESDFFMALFNFGIIGFILFLLIPIVIFIKSAKFIIQKLKKVDFEMWMLFVCLGIFFSISIYAGYTYIYTNFSIFLALLIIMLKLKMDILNQTEKEKISKINFLALHLGYGGIETSTINSANALSSDYKIEIISFYNLENNQLKNLNKNIEVRFLYNGEPKRDEFIAAVKSVHLFKAFRIGLTCANILLKKHFLIAKNIKKIKTGAIVSTRAEFNVLLSKYGQPGVLKIAQEHCYHNNNKKYIKTIANKYHNIDYLCALTTTLYEDYKKFLKYNPHTNVVLLPNMLFNLPDKKSNLNNKKFISVGRLDKGKRNDEIITNFSKLDCKEAELYIIGDGKEFESLSNLAKELNVDKKVHLLGYLSHDDIEKYMLDSSCFLMASVTEGLPMVLLEAMSYGVPCIVYRTESGTGDIVEDGINGYIIDDRNSELYASRMQKIITDNTLKDKMGKKAILTSKKFSKTEILKVWKKILNNEL